ncbi:MAG: hypothetical protein DMF67_14330 [Acidobacteria bacterium]|nr:MAG: hypothetical protein DMF67_14330 [Acidobacteriota bacterium]
MQFETSVKYESGATTPTGMTKVSLPGMDFSATKFSWLSITGTRAQVGGTGTINGTGLYGFLLTGSDGKLDGKKLPDRLRVKIWDQATGQIIYDGQAGAPDSAAPSSHSEAATFTSSRSLNPEGGRASEGTSTRVRLRASR